KAVFAGLGCIIRNCEGAVMVTATSKKPCLGDVEITEVLAILGGLMLAAEVTLSPLVIESDSNSVTKFILKGISCRGELDLIICEIRVLIDQDNQYRVVYTSRSCKLVTHDLAKMALANSESRGVD
ncbi:hypothetical protein CISIN_1g044837mg, partial [Citrus sinensis]